MSTKEIAGCIGARKYASWASVLVTPGAPAYRVLREGRVGSRDKSDWEYAPKCHDESSTSPAFAKSAIGWGTQRT